MEAILPAPTSLTPYIWWKADWPSNAHVHLPLRSAHMKRSHSVLPIVWQWNMCFYTIRFLECLSWLYFSSVVFFKRNYRLLIENQSSSSSSLLTCLHSKEQVHLIDRGCCSFVLIEKQLNFDGEYNKLLSHGVQRHASLTNSPCVVLCLFSNNISLLRGALQNWPFNTMCVNTLSLVFPRYPFSIDDFPFSNRNIFLKASI